MITYMCFFMIIANIYIYDTYYIKYVNIIKINNTSRL